MPAGMKSTPRVPLPGRVQTTVTMNSRSTVAKPPSRFQDYLMWQVELTPFSDTDRAIATSIVDAVDDTGYLTVTLDEILESIGDDEIELEEIEAVLKRVQRFDPIGVAAKDLRDCLLIQLSQFAKETPWIDEARLIISEHLDLLANHDFRTLMRVTRLKEEVLKEAVNLIQSPIRVRGNRSRPANRNTLFLMCW